MLEMESVTRCISDGVAVVDLQKDSDVRESETEIFFIVC